MLLVNYGHAESGKPYVVFYHGMRTDKNVNFSSGKVFENGVSLFPFHYSRKQFHPYWHVAKEIGNGFKMLFCKYFSRSHNASLVSIVNCNEHGH